ncbi:hypothetical protein BWI93_10155 [Siphonobacter sp. BAB-5385]|uniref:hypothetical protein n=1 Tax=Siphonobacter sp. BAB-5385 TaxID=1864822 RepID=UPI000B9ECDD1|nr:hypothetical protein [Siphonobacter sp. BAB-5385]OZI08220.1 hypothetical protein BWI93_10155 [Siphonobacter sp. BAB-5385]
MEILVPKSKLEEMMSMVSCGMISERNRIQGTVLFQKQEYALTGSCSSAKDGIISVDGYKAMLLNQYRGSIKPLGYSEHSKEINEGKRERSYHGLLTRDGDRLIVLEGPRITFKSLPTGDDQLTLF